MSMINATVFCVSARRTVFPWQIIAVEPPDSTFRASFNCKLKGRLDEGNDRGRLQLRQMYVGKKKESLDKVCISYINQ